MRRLTERRRVWRQGVPTDIAGAKSRRFVATLMRASSGNLLLGSLPAADLERLTGGHAPVDLRFAETLNEPGERIRHVYFPIDSFVSLIVPGEKRAQL